MKGVEWFQTWEIYSFRDLRDYLPVDCVCTGAVEWFVGRGTKGRAVGASVDADLTVDLGATAGAHIESPRFATRGTVLLPLARRGPVGMTGDATTPKSVNVHFFDSCT